MVRESFPHARRGMSGRRCSARARWECGAAVSCRTAGGMLNDGPPRAWMCQCCGMGNPV